MSIHAALYHKTQYTYDQPVGHGPHVVRLRPAPHCRTKILGYSQRITGGKHFINGHQYPVSNCNARLVFPDMMKEFCVEIELIVEMAVYNPFDFFVEDSAAGFPFAYDSLLKKDLTPFLEPCPLTPKFAAYFYAARRDILGAEQTPLRTIDFLVALNQRLQRDIKYLIRLAPGVQSPEETLTRLSGPLRDYGWLLVQLLRHFG